jgi:hypothetical protein
MIDRKKVMKQTEEAAQRSGRFRYLKKNATTSLRIAEYEDKDGDNMFAQLMTEHRREGQGGKGLGVCRMEVFGLPCAMCKVNQIASDTGKDRPFVSRSRYVVNGMDVNDKRKEFRLWVLPTSVFDDLAEYSLNEEWASLFEPKDGVVANIKREGSGLDTEYTTVLGRKAYPIDKKQLSQIVNPLDEIRDPGLEAQCAEIGVTVEDIFEANELEAVEKPAEKSKKTSKKATKKASNLKPPVFDIGQPVKYQDEEDICHVAEIDGDTYTIEDPGGGTWDVEADDLTAVEEDEGFSVGDSVFYQKEKTPCTIVSIDSDTQVTIRDKDGDEFDKIDITDLRVADDIPFEGGGDKKEEDAPKCFGDPQLYDEDDKECKACHWYDECGGNANLNKAGVGNNRKPAKKAGSSDADDIVASIVGGKRK